jgi:ribosomal protein S18 acetylase RimI-like enzyme
MDRSAVPFVRDYDPADEPAWLRCRVLAFLGTCYFDDVATAKPVEDDAATTIEVVAVADELVIGLLDVAVRGDLATIECVAVHPDYRRNGAASRLLSIALNRLADTPATSIDAWTREDADALAWYARQGFVQTDAYLHVYSGYGEARRMVSATGPVNPVSVFAHAPLEHESRLRAEYERVYVCRRMQRDLTR